LRGLHIADVLSGTYAFGAIVAALNQRERTGLGQLVDVSMLESRNGAARICLKIV
jgi:crotonobetainyl-CoA:carnitine CoA-transferase CaiB-like acyl-CoA transferase